MLLVYKDSPEELLHLDRSELSKRFYKVQSFERGNGIILRHHLLATTEISNEDGNAKETDRGESIKDFAKLPNVIRSAVTSFKFLQIDTDFEFSKDGLVLKNV